MKNTSESHPDYNVLLDARNKIDEVVNDINEASRLVEQQRKILDIQSNIEGLTDLVAPARALVREGTVLMKEGEGAIRWEKAVEMQIYLFNDMIIFAAKQHGIREMLFSKEYILKGQIPIPDARVILCADDEKKKNAFQITHEGKTYTVSGTDPEQSKLWFTEIKKLVKEHQLKKLKQSSSTNKIL